MAIELNLVLIRLSGTLFSYQIDTEAEETPAVESLLRGAKQKSDLRSASAFREGGVVMVS